MNDLVRSLPRGAQFKPPGAVIRTVVTYADGTQITITPDGAGGEETTCSRPMVQRADGTWEVVRR